MANILFWETWRHWFFLPVFCFLFFLLFFLFFLHFFPVSWLIFYFEQHDVIGFFFPYFVSFSSHSFYYILVTAWSEGESQNWKFGGNWTSGKGQNVGNHFIKSQKKEHRKSKIWKRSERRKYFQNVKSLVCLIFKLSTTYGISTYGVLTSILNLKKPF